MKRLRIWLITAVVAAGVLPAVAAELAFSLASRAASREPEATQGSGPCAVLVLGYPSRSDGALHPVQRLRTRAAVDAFHARGCTRLVFTGSAVANEHVEAEQMAALARTLGVPATKLVIEHRSRTTWENVGCATPHLADFDRIWLASDSLHVLRGRRYLCRQQPTWCPRVGVVAAPVPTRLIWWKVPASLHELGAWVRDVVLYEGGATSDTETCPAALSQSPD